MDFINKAISGGNIREGEQRTEGEQKSSGGFMDKLNSFAGGGKESEKNEDALDKGWCLPASTILRFHGALFTLRVPTNPGSIEQASILCRNTSSSKGLRTMRVLWNRPRMSRFPTSSATSTRRPRVPTSLSRIRRPNLENRRTANGARPTKVSRKQRGGSLRFRD